MERIGIAGKACEEFFRNIQELICDKGLVFEKHKDGIYYDALLILPDTELSDTNIRCGTLIIPDETLIGQIDAKSVISYGMSNKNTITLSSTQGKKKVIALQRDIASLDGKIILRQEYPMDSELSPYETMALAALVLITGEPD